MFVHEIKFSSSVNQLAFQIIFGMDMYSSTTTTLLTILLQYYYIIGATTLVILLMLLLFVPSPLVIGCRFEYVP